MFNESSSLKPARRVVCDSPVASATGVIPPRPIARVSTAAHRRRVRSSKSGASAANLALMAWVSGFGIAPDNNGSDRQSNKLFWRDAYGMRTGGTNADFEDVKYANSHIVYSEAVGFTRR